MPVTLSLELGSHPIGSQRSPDLSLEQAIRAKLAMSRCGRALRGLAVWANDGVVTLRGQTGSFYEKQLVLHAVQKVDGLTAIVDEITVPE